jgi:hypothetical protein
MRQVPETAPDRSKKRAKEGVRTLVTFAAKIHVTLEPLASGATATDLQARLPVLRTPAE